MSSHQIGRLHTWSRASSAAAPESKVDRALRDHLLQPSRRSLRIGPRFGVDVTKPGWPPATLQNGVAFTSIGRLDKLPIAVLDEVCLASLAASTPARQRDQSVSACRVLEHTRPPRSCRFGRALRSENCSPEHVSAPRFGRLTRGLLQLQPEGWRAEAAALRYPARKRLEPAVWQRRGAAVIPRPKVRLFEGPSSNCSERGRRCLSPGRALPSHHRPCRFLPCARATIRAGRHPSTKRRAHGSPTPGSPGRLAPGFNHIWGSLSSPGARLILSAERPRSRAAGLRRNAAGDHAERGAHAAVIPPRRRGRPR